MRLREAVTAPGERAILRDSGALAVAASGADPLLTAQGHLCVLQGSLYDVDVLVRELRLPTHVGVESLLVSAYRHMGAGLLERLRGEFSLLIWDETAGRGVLACDHLGASALFLRARGDELSFASELPNLLRALASRPAPDPVTVAHWLAMGGPPPGHTFYEGVTQLQGGHFVQLDRSSGWRVERYWQPSYRTPAKIESADAAERVRAQLADAVRRRSLGHTTGVLLSGGIDSAAVAGVAVAGEQPPAAAYSAVFPKHREIDESALIELLSRRLGLQSVALAVSDGSVLAGAARYIDEWEVPATSPNLFFWSQLLRTAAVDGVTMMLDGEGGDTLFWLSPHLLADRFTHGRLREVASLAGRFPSEAGYVPAAIRARLIRDWALKGAMPHRLHRWRRRLRGRGAFAPAWLSERSIRLRFDTDPTLDWKRWAAPRWWSSLLESVTGVSSTLVHDAARRRNASAGLRAGHPLLDVDVIELVLSLPPELAFDPALSRPLLRESVRGLIPDDVRLRPGKSSFDTLFHELLAGRELDAARSLLLAPDAEVNAFVKPQAVRQTLFARAPPRAPDALQIWALEVWRLLTAELWLRHQAGCRSQRQIK